MTPEHTIPHTILVAEDEEALRELMVVTLTQQGYAVLEASDGVEALRVWHTSSRRIELLLTDMIMPNGVTGAELANRLLKESPSLRVLYISGYSPEVLENAESLTEGVNFLPKPFGFQQLLETVQRSFSAQPASMLISGRPVPEDSLPNHHEHNHSDHRN